MGIKFTHHPDYDALPEPIKHAYSPKEYAVLPDELKKTLVDDECMPDEPEDWEPACE